MAVIYTDGGSRGNPGPSAIGYVIYNNNRILHAEGKFIGEATNNVAEYTAVIDALDKAIELGLTRITLASDSQVVVNQINETWRVKEEHLEFYRKLVHERLAKFKKWEIIYTPREDNQIADFFVNWTLDQI